MFRVGLHLKSKIIFIQFICPLFVSQSPRKPWMNVIHHFSKVFLSSLCTLRQIPVTNSRYLMTNMIEIFFSSCWQDFFKVYYWNIIIHLASLNELTLYCKRFPILYFTRLIHFFSGYRKDDEVPQYILSYV